MFPGNVIAIFDLELTAWPGTAARNWSGPGEYREIIQIGAVAVDIAAGWRETAAFQMLVRPRLNPRLSPYITELTGITQAQVDERGVAFPAMLDAFLAFLEPDTGAVCYNGHDDEVLRENCRFGGLDPARLDGLPFHNLQPFFRERLGRDGKPLQSCQLMELAGLTTDQRGHDGLADSRIILGALRHLVSHTP